LNNIHYQLMNSIIAEIDSAISRTGKSPSQIFDNLLRVHPEVAFSFKDWNELRPEVQDAITTRIKHTLAKMA